MGKFIHGVDFVPIKGELWMPIPDFIGYEASNADNHHGRKLNSSQVFEICDKFEPRVYTRKKLASEYGVSVAAIKKILNKTNWATIWS